MWSKTHGFNSFGEVAGEFCGYSVDLAKSNRSSCKKCKQGIVQGDLRIGTNFFGSGDFIQPSWRHYKCHGAGNFSVVKDETELVGFDELPAADQSFVRDFFAGTLQTQKSSIIAPKEGAKKRKAKEAKGDSESEDSDSGYHPKKVKPAAKKKIDLRS